MLDKTLTYAGYSITTAIFSPNQPPLFKFKRVNILFEDDISWYVESLTSRDRKGNGIRYSVKKHCFRLIPIRSPKPKTLEPNDLIHILELTEKSIRTTAMNQAGIILRADNWLKIRTILYRLLRITETEGNTIYCNYEVKRSEQRNQNHYKRNRRY